MLKEVTPEAAAHLLAKVVTLGDGYYAYTDQLIAEGFCSLRALLENVEVFAQNQQELDLHRQIFIEAAKEEFCTLDIATLGWPPGMTCQSLYQSELITMLKAQFLQSHPEEVPQKWPRTKAAYYSDPVWSRLNGLDPIERFKLRHYNFEPRFRALRQEEANNLIADPMLAVKLPEPEAAALGEQFMTQYAGRAGFHFNEKLASKRFRPFTKPLTGDWILCLAALTDGWSTLLQSGFIIDGKKCPTPNSVQFHLDIRRANQKGLGHKKPTIVPLQYYQFSPFRSAQFSSYHTMDECAVGIMGYVRLYELMADRMEAGLIEGLREL